jgi:hypothetical protein
MLIGNPFRFTSLGNVGIKSASTAYQYRFRATGGDVTGVRLFTIFRSSPGPTGYWDGTGGQLKVELCEDDGTVLDSYTDTTPMAGGTNGVRWPLYPLTATLVPGNFYRLKFSNPGASPGSNWISIDDAYLGSTQPGWAELGIAAQNGGGSQNTNHTPCFELEYDDGDYHDGVCWIDIPSGYNANNTATLVIRPDGDYDITDIFVGINNDPTPSGTLTATLKEGSTTLWTDTTPAAVGWCRFDSVGVTILEGTEYRLTVTGSFRIRPMQKGTARGFSEPSIGGIFSDSRSGEITLPIYLAVDEGGGSPGQPPNNLTAPVISGEAVEGETLTLSNGTWDGSGLSFTRQWLLCDADGESCSDIVGETATTYVVDSADVGGTIRGEVTATNVDGSDTATSAETGVVGGSTGSGSGAPVNVVAPAAPTGEARVGRTLHASPGQWDGDTPMTFTYQWSRYDASGANGAEIPGANDVDYTLVSADAGKRLGYRVTALN